MSVVGVSTVKDEADVVEWTLRHMADEVDSLVVADNGSRDGTREILAWLADELPLTVVDDPEVGYYQSRRITRLADEAAAGALSGSCRSTRTRSGSHRSAASGTFWPW